MIRRAVEFNVLALCEYCPPGSIPTDRNWIEHISDSNGSRITELFHSRCLVMKVKENGGCPLCRRSVTSLQQSLGSS